jgi:hypothetical protein
LSLIKYNSLGTFQVPSVVNEPLTDFLEVGTVKHLVEGLVGIEANVWTKPTLLIELDFCMTTYTVSIWVLVLD